MNSVEDLKVIIRDGIRIFSSNSFLVTFKEDQITDIVHQYEYWTFRDGKLKSMGLASFATEKSLGIRTPTVFFQDENEVIFPVYGFNINEKKIEKIPGIRNRYQVILLNIFEKEFDARTIDELEFKIDVIKFLSI
jgi:hypothetical protein